MNLSVLPFSAVLFDLDNTLLDREAGFELFCRELYRTNPVMSQSHSERRRAGAADPYWRMRRLNWHGRGGDILEAHIFA